MIKVTNYIRPKGRAERVTINNVSEQASLFFSEGWEVSIEAESKEVAILYARPTRAEEEEEIIVLADMSKESYAQAFDRLMKECMEEWPDVGF